MSPSYALSTGATHGSAEDSIQVASDGSNANHTSSNSKNESSDTTSSSVTNYQQISDSSANQHEYSTYRIATFLNDKVGSQVMHPNSSTTARIYNHTAGIAAYLDDFEAALKKEYVF